MWGPIFITVLAASGNNIGKVLQKQATRTLPKLTLRREILTQYVSSRTWLLGTVADLSGALLMIVAFAHAPVSVVQPVSAVGLAVLLIFSHFYLNERLKATEWGAAAVAFAGVLGLGMSSEPGHLAMPDHLHPARIALAFLAMVAALALECWWRHGSQAGSHPGAPLAAAAAAQDAVLCGLEGGSCFGLSAAACRTGFILAKRVSWVWAPLGLSGSVMLTSSGFFLQTKGLKNGNTVVVCTMAAVASMVTGVLAGLVALGEALPTSHAMKVARLGSWAAILLGVSSLAGGQDGLAMAGRALAAVVVSRAPRIPLWMWRLIPRPLALLLHKTGKRLGAAADAHKHDSDLGGQLLPLSLPPGGTGAGSTSAVGGVPHYRSTTGSYSTAAPAMVQEPAVQDSWGVQTFGVQDLGQTDLAEGSSSTLSAKQGHAYQIGGGMVAAGSGVLFSAQAEGFAGVPGGIGDAPGLFVPYNAALPDKQSKGV